MNTISCEEDLKSALEYNPCTGIITWKNGTRCQGKEAGHCTKRGHRTISRKGILYQAHRIAWLLHYGTWPKNGIDHIDGNPSNNAINNLRDVGQDQNNKNKCIRKDSCTKVTGVSWCKITNKWRAYISIKGKPVRLGYFDDFNLAVTCRKNAEIEHGYHKNHGRPIT